MPVISAQPVVDIEDIIVILIVIAVVMGWLARLRKHAPRIVR